MKSTQTKLSFLTLAFLALIYMNTATAQSRGYVDLDDFRGINEADVTVDINLGGWILGMVHTAAEDLDDDQARIMKSIENVRVRVFNISDNSSQLRSSFLDLSQELSRDGWDTLIKVREDNEHVDVMVIGSEDSLEGIAILVLDDENEAVMVNITGNIDPADVAAIMDDGFLGDFDIDLDI